MTGPFSEKFSFRDRDRDRERDREREIDRQNRFGWRQLREIKLDIEIDRQILRIM